MAVARSPDPQCARARAAVTHWQGAARAALHILLVAGVAAGWNTAQAVDPDSELARHLQAERRQHMEVAIARSSEQIESAGVEGAALAAAFRARGIARSHLLQHAEALVDLTRAVELDPFNAQYYEDRARTYLKLREFKAAGEDLDMALGLDSKRWSAQRDEGRVAAYQGDFHQAVVEFRRAFWLTDEETGLYNVLWLDIASRRAGGGGTAILDELLAQADDPGRWPVPLLRMFRSRLTAQQAVASATTTDPRKSLLQKCEAWFYAGQLYLIGGERDQAKAAFEAAVATGAVEYLEYDWALRELELLSIAP